MAQYMPNRNIPVKHFYANVELSDEIAYCYNALMQNIARIRKLRGWTQEELGLEIGVNQATISKAEKGEGGTSLKTYQAIASALDTPLHILFSPEMTSVELKLISVFRELDDDRKQGWLDMIDGPLSPPQRSSQ
jgi:transcriptional regulator with XRE-family HTH domain